MNPPIGRRLLDARELRELTQTALAKLLDVPQPTVSQIEKAERPFSEHLTMRAAQATQLPVAFFQVAPTPLDVCVPTFRKSSEAKAADERRIVRLHREAARVFELVSQQSGYHTLELPDEVQTLDEHDAAAAIRAQAGIAETDPIPNVTRLLERLGFGVVTSLDAQQSLEYSAHSGISIPSAHATRPLISTPHTYRGDAMRFTLAHELGHHIWDRDVVTPSASTRSPQERRAHAFANALLLPRSVVNQRVSEELGLNGYLPIKADYGISVGAIIMAAKQAGVISPARARSLQIQLSARGWRAAEPVEVPNETPLLFKQAMVRVTHGDQHTAESITGLPAEILHRWTRVEFSANVMSLEAWRRERVEAG